MTNSEQQGANVFDAQNHFMLRRLHGVLDDPFGEYELLDAMYSVRGLSDRLLNEDQPTNGFSSAEHMVRASIERKIQDDIDFVLSNLEVIKGDDDQDFFVSVGRVFGLAIEPGEHDGDGLEAPRYVLAAETEYSQADRVRADELLEMSGRQIGPVFELQASILDEDTGANQFTEVQSQLDKLEASFLRLQGHRSTTEQEEFGDYERQLGADSFVSLAALYWYYELNAQEVVEDIVDAAMRANLSTFAIYHNTAHPSDYINQGNVRAYINEIVETDMARAERGTLEMISSLDEIGESKAALDVAKSLGVGYRASQTGEAELYLLDDHDLEVAGYIVQRGASEDRYPKSQVEMLKQTILGQARIPNGPESGGSGPAAG